MRKVTASTSLVFCCLAFSCCAAVAGNCLVQGDVKIGDCSNVNVGPAKDLTIHRSGSHSGNFGRVVVKQGATASLSGNFDRIVVESGARLDFSGNADNIDVFGWADINGNADAVAARPGAEVVIRGIVSTVSGAGRVIKVKGAIIGGVYIK